MRRTLSLAAPAAGFAPWGTIDGHVLLRQLVDVFDKGEQAPVPLLAGFNSGEIRSLRSSPRILPRVRPRTKPPFATAMATWPTNFCGSIPAPTWRRASWPQRETPCTAGRRSDWSENKPHWGSRLSSTFLITATRPPTTAGLHGFHASELPYVFGTVDSHAAALAEDPGNARKRRALSDAMIGYWTSFARTGRPQAAASAGLAGVRIDRRLHGIRGNSTAGRSSLARNVRVQRGDCLPAPSEPGTSPGVGMSAYIRPNSQLSRRNVNSDGPRESR